MERCLHFLVEELKVVDRSFECPTEPLKQIFGPEQMSPGLYLPVKTCETGHGGGGHKGCHQHSSRSGYVEGVQIEPLTPSLLRFIVI